MQPLAVRLRASRRRLVAESELEFHEAIVGNADTTLSSRFAGDVEPRFLSRGADSYNNPGFVFSRDALHEIECPRRSSGRRTSN